MLKNFVKAHYGKLGMGGFVISTDQFCVIASQSDVGPHTVASLVVLAFVWLLALTACFVALVEEFE